MSGGYSNYNQFRIKDIANELEEYINGEELGDCEYDEIVKSRNWYDEEFVSYVKEHHATPPNEHGYTEETIEEFKKGLAILKLAAIYTQRIDWLLSGDDTEQSFHRRLKIDLEKIEKE